jgi:hypothetical protein
MAVTGLVGAAEQSQVTVQVTDSFGGPVPAERIVFASGTVNTEIQQNRIIDLAYGTYTVAVRVEGFQAASESVVIDQPQQVVSIGMKVGAIDGPLPKCGIVGHLQSDAVAVRMRAVMLFSVYSSDVAVGRDDFFEFRDIECGDYLLVALGATKCLGTQIVRAGGLLPPGTPKVPNYLGARIEMKAASDGNGCGAQK